MVVHMLPLIVLAIGIITLTSYAVVSEKPSASKMWLWHSLILLLALICQVLVISQHPITYLRGGLINDGITSALGILILVASLFLQFNRVAERNDILPNTTLLSLCVSFFCLTAVQSNRIIFSVLSIVGMMLSAKGALANEAPEKLRADHAYTMIRRSFGFLIFSLLYVSICLLTFGETQFDQIQIHLARARENILQIQLVQLMVLFGAMSVGELPPLMGIFSSARKNSSWAMSVVFSSLFALVALQLFIKQGLFIFTRVSVGAVELEPQLGTHILLYMKIIAGIGLIVLPILALVQKNIKQSLLLFMLNPVLQILMALSFGQKELMSYAIGALPQMVVAMSLLILTAKALELTYETELRQWVGLGRTEPLQGTFLLVAVWALAGFAPFYSGRLVQKTLCVNSDLTVFVAINTALCGYYAARLTAFAFQKPLEAKGKGKPLLEFEKIFSYSQVLLLFLMGIFWQPLYKYGSYTIRHLFGEF